MTTNVIDMAKYVNGSNETFQDIELQRGRKNNNNDYEESTDTVHTRAVNKRQKLIRDNLADFKPGSIIKIKLHNFVTYEFTEFDLSPSLNMIIGPNGSGKSTFVCAVCLGLAGKPEYIGRSRNVDDYIKNDEEHGEIEITLKNSEAIHDVEGVLEGSDTITITRILTRSKKKSEYKINDSLVTEATVKELVSLLNIQLDNLCQFLSQERVEEFARLKSERLLEETVRSIDPSLLTILNNLKELQTTELDIQTEVTNDNNKLGSLRKRREKYEKSVASYEVFNKTKHSLQVNTKLLPYAKVNEYKDQFKSLKEEYKAAKKKLKALQQDKEPFNREKDILERKLIDTERRTSSTLISFQKAKDNLKLATKDLNDIQESIHTKKKQIEYYKNRTKLLSIKINESKVEIENKQDILGNLPPFDDVHFNDLRSQSSQLITKEGDIEANIRSLRSKSKSIEHEINNLSRLESNKSKLLTSKDRIGILDQGARDLQEVKRAVLYLRQKPEMKGKILEPPIMTVSVSDPSYASFLAQCVDYNTCKAFTIIDSETYNLYADQILKQFKVNLREMRPITSEPPLSRAEIQSLGFDGYLKDFVRGDENVIHMLCQISNIHLIPVSKKALTPQQLKKLTVPDANGHLLFRRILHGNRIMDINKSSYGSKQVFTRDGTIRDTKFYRESVIARDFAAKINSEISQIKQRIKEGKEHLETVIQEEREERKEKYELEKQRESISKELKKLNNLQKEHSYLKSTIESLNQKWKQLEHESKKDTRHKIKDDENAIISLFEKQSKTLAKYVTITETINEYQEELMTSEISHYEYLNLFNSIGEVIKMLNDREIEFNNEYLEKKENFEKMKTSENFKAWTSEIASYDEPTKAILNEFAKEYNSKEQFTVQFLNDQISKLESELALLNSDGSSIEILAQIKQELESLEKNLPAKVIKLNKIKETMATNREILEPRLDDIINKISNRFSQLFINAGSASQIVLDKPILYADWKIQILVKFRDNADLKPLDSHTQSGGEKAVSTVFYMIALQEFTIAPFRVVDEINQGMDPRNEKIVHQSMVENACADNTSQYFLITPKLLTGLFYHEKMRVHCVMAGPWIPDPLKNPHALHLGNPSKYTF
ncbi:hypothetical protein TPHA_0L00600 [Tetrapisispora phaffii CBS 4417]|uniref:Structural maintenance of chromosomes protein 5 n=1 Tax=Tetrapisispora phaffii (strain ATCC 24235 / CBS 4417 / NBRC 1672 / NRRL Y-8282 / UCD 70-5) TaxID=1071381 RepID=G8BZT8_TETPH|nr:hypothetical protein TPHA_0L00600 [Tetrapisispora phaffii CBS 4417]CCE65416.1 hypothetical protein TPHA_0L00600 [Tetrapisispora phaffii CBS 4417]